MSESFKYRLLGARRSTFRATNCALTKHRVGRGKMDSGVKQTLALTFNKQTISECPTYTERGARWTQRSTE